jgi:hypothetical protein
LEADTMIYALWDTETNSLVAEFGDIEHALMLVRNGIEHNGPQDTDGLLLQEETEHGDVRPIRIWTTPRSACAAGRLWQ